MNLRRDLGKDMLSMLHESDRIARTIYFKERGAASEDGKGNGVDYPKDMESNVLILHKELPKVIHHYFR